MSHQGMRSCNPSLWVAVLALLDVVLTCPSVARADEPPRAEETPTSPRNYPTLSVGIGGGGWLLGVEGFGTIGLGFSPRYRIDLSLVAGTSIPGIKTTQLQLSGSVFLSDAVFVRGGLQIERTGPIRVGDDDYDFQVVDTAIGPLVGIGSRWEGKHLFVSVEWLGLSVPVPLSQTPTPPAYVLASGTNSSLPLELRVLNLTLGGVGEL